MRGQLTPLNANHQQQMQVLINQVGELIKALRR
jgi:hypothetical protein